MKPVILWVLVLPSLNINTLTNATDLFNYDQAALEAQFISPDSLDS